MCNAYNIGSKVSASEIEQIISEEVRKLPSPLVRRGGPGVILLQSDQGMTAETMRWGFDHPQYKLVNNARSDSLLKKRGMWFGPLQDSRCLVPVSRFYEWGERIHGVKPAYEFSRPDGEWLWVAGLYERTGGGAHYATITTEPTAQVVPFHDRLLAVVELEDGLSFLRGEKSEFEPYAGELVIRPCVSPLLQPKPPNPQGELF